MTTICKKCRHYRRLSIIAGERLHRCYAFWGAQTIHRVTGDLTPDSWDCNAKNPVDGPCPNYEQSWMWLGNLIFLGLCAALVLVAWIIIFYTATPEVLQ
jgi:hypothetical protein